MLSIVSGIVFRQASYFVVIFISVIMTTLLGKCQSDTDSREVESFARARTW